MKKKKVVAIIPIKKNSKRVKKKNFKTINNKNFTNTYLKNYINVISMKFTLIQIVQKLRNIQRKTDLIL